jgi:hypothetical protein
VSISFIDESLFFDRTVPALIVTTISTRRLVTFRDRRPFLVAIPLI